MDYVLGIYRLKSLLYALDTYCKTRVDCEDCAFAIGSYRCQSIALGEVIASIKADMERDNDDQK
jgi:hypothetical protein